MCGSPESHARHGCPSPAFVQAGRHPHDQGLGSIGSVKCTLTDEIKPPRLECTRGKHTQSQPMSFPAAERKRLTHVFRDPRAWFHLFCCGRESRFAGWERPRGLQGRSPGGGRSKDWQPGRRGQSRWRGWECRIGSDCMADIADQMARPVLSRLQHRGSASTTLDGRTVVLIWLLSVVLHFAGLIVMLLVVFPFSSEPDRDQPVTHVELVGPIDAVNIAKQPRPDLSPADTPSDPLEQPITPQPSDQLSQLLASRKAKLPIVGIGSGGADFSKYGLSGGSGAAPKFFGLGESVRGARRIVYVVDRSGSMLDTFGYVRDELNRSVGALRRSQKFHVILFNAGQPLESPPGHLVSAINVRKKALAEFLQGVFPSGGTEPERAMRRALALDPDLIYFLTDGAFDPSLLGRLDRWNKRRRVRIFTIAFFDRGGADLLERIAREHGGEFKFVSEHDVP